MKLKKKKIRLLFVSLVVLCMMFLNVSTNFINAENNEENAVNNVEEIVQNESDTQQEDSSDKEKSEEKDEETEDSVEEETETQDSQSDEKKEKSESSTIPKKSISKKGEKLGEGVAQIGETVYPTLQDAINAVSEGQTIQLLSDIEENVTSKDKSYTLDMQDHTMKPAEGNKTRIYTITSGTVTLKNGTITGSNALQNSSARNRDGAGLYIERSANVILEKLVFSKNNGRYGSGINVDSSTLTANDLTVTDNFAKSSAAIYLVNSKVDLTDLKVVNNECSSTSGTNSVNGISLNGTELNITHFTIKDNGTNTGETGGICLALSPSHLVLNNGKIENNYGKNVGGIYDYSNPETTIEIKDTTIKENTGEKWCGGIYLRRMCNFNFSSGALYNNYCFSDADDVANELGVESFSGTYSLKMIPASEMKDGDFSFDGYVWYEKSSNTEVTGALENPQGAHFYNAYMTSNRYVAELNNNQFQTVNEAIQEAHDGDVIKLIAGESDSTAKIINENIIFNENKSLTLDLNGRSIQINKKDNPNGYALTLGENAKMNIIGSSQGAIESIDYSGEKLYIDSEVSIKNINLADGKYITVGKNFKADKLSFSLSEDTYNLLEEGTDVKLIVPEDDATISDELIKNITLKNGSPLIVVKKDSQGNVVAHKMNGVFAGGKGNDANDGLSPSTPVKTFEKAKEILDGLSDDVEGIFVVDTITNSSGDTWTLSNDYKLMRYPGFKGYLIDVNGTLTLKDIVIDGMKDLVMSDSALIKVSNSEVLKIDEGAKLINNYNSKSAGGAIYCSNGNIEMTDGEISGNIATIEGGGISLINSEMQLDGGLLKNNKTLRDSTRSYSAGGAIFVNGSKLNMTAGRIDSNSTDGTTSIGGGIAVGGMDKIDPSEFNMTGGSIVNNETVIDGGGIYIQCNSVATITGGEISYNRSNGNGIGAGAAGAYGGGGIYVNGGFENYEDGKLYLKNVLITDNNVRGTNGNGSGIAGCGTSTVYLYPNQGGVIYGNSGNSQLYVNSTQSSGYGTIAKAFISEYMPNGKLNQWTNQAGQLVSSNDLQNLKSGTILNLNNHIEDESGNDMSVKIVGNYSYTRGGGIGTNGFVQIGEPEDCINIPVTKKWNDASDKNNARPDSIKVWLERKTEENQESEKVSFIEFKKESDEWLETLTFKNVPIKDENGHDYIYSVIEEMPLKDDGTQYPYVSHVTGNTDDGFVVTNTITTPIKGTKVWNDNNNQNGTRPNHIDIDILNGNEVVKTVTVSPNTEGKWQWAVNDLPKYDGDTEIQYTIREHQVEGYESKINGNGEDGFTITNTIVKEPVNPTNPDDNIDSDVLGDDIENNDINSNVLGDSVDMNSKKTNTSDNQNMMLYGGLTVIALLGLVLLKKKKSSKE